MTKESSSQAVVPMDELRRVVKLMKDNDLSFFQFEKDGYKVKMRRGPEPGAFRWPMPRHLPRHRARRRGVGPRRRGRAGCEAGARGRRNHLADGRHILPLASPEAEPFVNAGDTRAQRPDPLHHRGDEGHERDQGREVAGTITAVLAEDGTPVQFGEVAVPDQVSPPARTNSQLLPKLP